LVTLFLKATATLEPAPEYLTNLKILKTLSSLKALRDNKAPDPAKIKEIYKGIVDRKSTIP